MKKYCLVCEEFRDFNNLNDDDCLRCSNCLSIHYTELDSPEIVNAHREEWRKNNDCC